MQTDRAGGLMAVWQLLGLAGSVVVLTFHRSGSPCTRRQLFVPAGFTVGDDPGSAEVRLSVGNAPESDVVASVLEHCEPVQGLVQQLRVDAAEVPVRLALYRDGEPLPTRVRSWHLAHAAWCSVRGLGLRCNRVEPLQTTQVLGV